jgi:hypothetical protein
MGICKVAMPPAKLQSIVETRDRLVDIGDLDLRRNLKIRAFLHLVLAPVFRDMQPKLRYVEMGRRGITPMQYYQDFRNHPARLGYGNHVQGRYEVRLCRSLSRERRGGAAGSQRVERLILETVATLTASPATARPESMGFEPSLDAPVTAGTGRVLHVLTRPQNPPGQRWVNEVPEEIGFLSVHPFEGPFPTIALLREVEAGFAELTEAATELRGIWGLANSDVFQHVHAREYTMAMENGIALALAAAGLPLDRHDATRARVIFRRPSFIGQRYVLRIRLFRREAETVALGALHAADEGRLDDDARASVFLRFEGRLA